MSNATNPSRILAAAKSLPRTPGVYLLQHAGTGGTYVGVALNVRTRVLGHLRELRAGSHCNDRLSELARAGLDGFTVSVLEQIAPADRWPAEARWMKKLRPTLNRLGPNDPAVPRPLLGDRVTIRAGLTVPLLKRLAEYCERHPLEPTHSQAVQAALTEYLDREEADLPPKAKRG